MICTVGQQGDAMGQNLINPNQSVGWLKVYCGQNLAHLLQLILLQQFPSKHTTTGSVAPKMWREKGSREVSWVGLVLCGGKEGRFDWRLCFSITDRKTMTQLMTHTYKCPPKYTVVFYSVCTEVEKLMWLVFIFRLSC